MSIPKGSYGGFGMTVLEQAALDYKHINDRFQRGKTAINKLMDEKHHLVTVNNLVMSHSQIVSTQQSMGPNGLLD